VQILLTTDLVIHVFYKFKRFRQKRDLPTYCGTMALLYVSSEIKKAKEEKLIGITVQLSVVKVGGINEKLTSRKYKLTLIDKKGQELQIDVYGIDKITSHLLTFKL